MAELPQDLTDRIAREENEQDRAAVNKYIVNPVKGAAKKLYENIMGTEEQNAAAEASEIERARKNPKGNEAKFRKAMGKPFSSGGKVSSASKRGDGCAQRGKTKGRIV
jgi:hypothetical protein